MVSKVSVHDWLTTEMGHNITAGNMRYSKVTSWQPGSRKEVGLGGRKKETGRRQSQGKPFKDF
jgi:hypothetical protein